MEKFCESLREPTIKITNFFLKKKEVIKKRIVESYENSKIC